ncbi:MAG: 50S ribosomal protein L11 methyltransferase [Clostridium sp.]|jgi:ribosomal protein L11 methyltransferase|nr:50S ribosomal protein L11 methyltransferase [Clostridium sp.]
MKWKKFKIWTLAETEDIVISALSDLGLEGAQIEDKVPLTASERERMFVDIPPQYEEDDGTAQLSFFAQLLEDGTLEVSGRSWTQEGLLEAIQEELEGLRRWADIGDGSIEIEETQDLDWVNNWKQYFRKFTVDGIVIIPSWEKTGPQAAGRPVLRMDPGTAFGTGMHETTQLCIRALRKYVTEGAAVLDVGTGSGILGMVALLSGAGAVTGTDLDPCAAEAAAKNCEANWVTPERFRLVMGNLITEEDVRSRVGYGCYDIVAANIVAEVLVPLTPVALCHLKQGGVYITSGIIDDKEQVVAQAVAAAGMEILETNRQGEWVSIVARKV